MKTFSVLFFSLLLTSCLTVNRIQRNCDKFAAICINEQDQQTSSKDTTIIHRDTVTVWLPKDSVHIRDSVRIIDNLAYMPRIEKTFGLITASAEVSRSLLDVRAWLNDSSILVPRRDTIKIPGAVRETVKTVTVTKEPGKWMIWVIVILAASVVVLAGRVLISR